ncbi:MAG TPA: S8 family serine peptidase, partial [Vicinamibacterales bacterium]|nr:S8 family serine peptidase [Vicinamibacterales bacterium]
MGDRSGGRSFFFQHISLSGSFRAVLTSSPWPRALAAALAIIVIVAPRVSTQAPRRRTIEVLGGREVVAGEALVTMKRGAVATGLTALDLETNRQLAGGIRHVRGRGRSTRELLAALAARPDVARVEPNYVARAAALPNDPYFDLESGLFNRNAPGADSHATAAWNITTGGAGSVVALVDSGVDYTHPDLAPNIWTAPAAFTVTVGGTAITYPAGSHGFNAIAMTCDPMDDYGHGTAMAGVIGAGGNNAVGVVGMNWHTSILPIKFLGSDGWGSYADAIKSIEFAIQARNAFASTAGANVRVLSNSWGGGGFSQALLDEIARAASNDMLLVASAGNDSSDNDSVPEYPASYDAANVLAVAATTNTDTLQPYSNYGATSVDLGAPSAAYSTAIGGAYAWTDGTSPAAALTSGAAALTLSACRLSAADLRQTLMSAVDPLTSLAGRVSTAGRLNVDRAIHMCRGDNAAPSVRLTSPEDGTQVEWPSAMTLAADAADVDGTVARVDFYAGSTWIGRATSAPFSITWKPGPGTYHLSAIATDTSGATGASTEAVTVSVEQPPDSLPSGWQTQDIGSTGVSGSASFT